MPVFSRLKNTGKTRSLGFLRLSDTVQSRMPGLLGAGHTTERRSLGPLSVTSTVKSRAAGFLKLEEMILSHALSRHACRHHADAGTVAHMLSRRRRYRKRIRPLPVKSAPGNLETLRLFLSPPKSDCPDEPLETPEALTRWLAGRGLIPEAAELTEDEARRGLEIRDALLALVRKDNDAADRMERVFRDLRYRVVFEGGPRFRPIGEGVERAFGELLAIYVRAWQAGRWGRLKACQECGQIFYDFSKNRSAKWCNDLCGERVRRATARRRRKHRPR